jgi:hypothetical protein
VVKQVVQTIVNLIKLASGYGYDDVGGDSGLPNKGNYLTIATGLADPR